MKVEDVVRMGAKISEKTVIRRFQTAVNNKKDVDDLIDRLLANGRVAVQVNGSTTWIAVQDGSFYEY